MNKNTLHGMIFGVTILICLHGNAIGYDDKVTHPDITERAAEASNLDDYLIVNLGLENGIETKFPSNTNNDVRHWLLQGAELEDDPMCRASNHFHDPLPRKTWGQSFMSDDITILASGVREYCNLRGWDYTNSKIQCHMGDRVSRSIS